MPLIQELLKQGIIDKKQAKELEDEIKASSLREEDLILNRGITSEDFLLKLKSKQSGVIYQEEIPKEIPQEILSLIPEESAKHYEMIAIGKDKGVVKVGMIHPEDLKSQEALKFLSRQSKFEYDIILISRKGFEEVMKEYRTLRQEVGEALEKLEQEQELTKGMDATNQEEMQRLVEEAPISKMVAVILRHAVEGNASDIHIEPTRDKLKVRFRMLGQLYASIYLPLAVHPAVIARLKILSSLKIDENRRPQDGRFSTTVSGKHIDFRVATFPTTLGEKVAIRVLDPESGTKSFSDLGIESNNLKIVEEAAKKPIGMILATGPTGSGKTTTLYSLLRTLNKENVNIVTLEDPVEYFMEGVNQSQVRPEIGYTFAEGLRQILRQDPDIIMVGEIRDEETANLAIHAALTGHLVLSTLHTNNATGVVPRLVDMGIKPYLISPTLSIAIAQRLVRKLCDNCKEEYEPAKEIKDLIQAEINTLPEIVKKDVKIKKDFKLFKNKGCDKCNDTGFTGRIGLYEILKSSKEIENLILKEPSENALADLAKSQGMITMKQDGFIKVINGVTTLEEVLRVADKK
jgi:type IV pilus assembly protein PilB